MEEERPAGNTHEGRPKVLVVDDEPAIGRILARSLNANCDVSVETRALAVLDRLKGGERFDVIVCDLTMPDMDGVQLHSAITSLTPQQARKMIFCTGGALTKDAEDFLSERPERTLQKPVRLNKLVETVMAMANDEELPVARPSIGKL